MNRVQRPLILFPTAFLAAALTLWVDGCKKDESSPPGPPAATGIATVRGIVTRADTSGSVPVAGASVTVGTGTPVTTGASGDFSVSVTPGASVTLIIAKPGFSTNDVVVTVADGVTKSVAVGLLREGANRTFAVTSRDSVADRGYKLTIPPNFVNASGNITVSVTGLDPTTSEIRALPAGLQAIDAQGNTKYLQPVSFAEYTARDANGNIVPVNQTSGQGANIELPIPESLRNQYRNGDPIECYLYDAASGKWKTPVPGVVGPSSIDGMPAIKATIFHMSWYGGAPALNARACIRGYVRNSNGTPAPGVDVEGFAGGTGTTNSQGFYQIDAAPNSNVRVVASAVQGTTIRSGEVLVFTGAAGDTCTLAPDITLGAPTQGSFSVTAILASSLGFGEAIVNIDLVTPGGQQTHWDSALVKVGYGTQMTTLQAGGSGSYFSLLSAASGQTYSITIDFDKNGTVDANGQVTMVGGSRITNPADSAVVGRTFTATWADSGSSVPGYAATYYLFLSGGDSSIAEYFQTTQRSKVIGNGIVDTSIYGYPQPNNPLAAGSYTMELWGFNGPFATFGNPLPNINGQNVVGYFYSYAFAAPVQFRSTGAGASSRPFSMRRPKMPLALREMYNRLPKEIKQKIHFKL